MKTFGAVLMCVIASVLVIVLDFALMEFGMEGWKAFILSAFALFFLLIGFVLYQEGENL